MKTTLDIPDALYRRFKMKTAMNGESIRNATLAFITSYVNGRACGLDASGVPLQAREGESAALPDWAGLAAPFVTAHAEGPHDMASIRRALAKTRTAERRS